MLPILLGIIIFIFMCGMAFLATIRRRTRTRTTNKQAKQQAKDYQDLALPTTNSRDQLQQIAKIMANTM